MLPSGAYAVVAIVPGRPEGSGDGGGTAGGRGAWGARGAMPDAERVDGGAPPMEGAGCDVRWGGNGGSGRAGNFGLGIRSLRGESGGSEAPGLGGRGGGERSCRSEPDGRSEGLSSFGMMTSAGADTEATGKLSAAGLELDPVGSSGTISRRRQDLA